MYSSAYLDEQIYFIYDEYDIPVSESYLKWILKRNDWTRKVIIFGYYIFVIINLF